MADPLPEIVEHNGFLVVRDDKYPGGTKARVLRVLFDGHREYVYASPAEGYAQVALAYAAQASGVRATVFTAKRRTPHERTAEAIRAGARVVSVSPGYMTVVRARARAYCQISGAMLLPFGLDAPPFILALADLAKRLPIRPKEVWSVAGSGVLTRALQMAWPKASFYAVRIGTEPLAGRASVYIAPERFSQRAREMPPFPSCDNYDAKAWQFVRAHGKQGALFWNVAA